MTDPHKALRMTRRAALALAMAGGLTLAGGPAPAFAQTAADPEAVYDRLLKRYVVEGGDGVTRVDYGAWRANAADRAALDGYIEALAARRPSTMGRDEVFAFWGNLYNAITLKVILDRYPVASIRDIKSDNWFDPKAYLGPWRQERVTVEGRRLSLDNIEHDIMRPTLKDPRVHYVVNCASYGCPNLMARAWRAETLEADMNAAARAFINHPRGVSVMPNGALRVSSIFRWFGEDFGPNDAALLAHFRAFADPPLAGHLARNPRIAEDAYDWSLNDAARAPAPRG
jgi:hypothetical protein